MKKKLLKPPANNGEMLFLPDPGTFLASVGEESRVGVAHQPYFFNPGVSVKFLFLENIPRGRKEIVFVDTDRVTLDVRIPSRSAWPERVHLIDSEHILCDFPMPGQDVFSSFFASVEDKLSRTFPDDPCGCLRHFAAFREIMEKNSERELLRELLAESFLGFYGSARNYRFLSDFFKEDDYREFVNRICADAASFRKIFNQALDDYGDEFRFRFKNFPFPKLLEDELPFWILEGGKRRRGDVRDLEGKGDGALAIVPRAATLTLFLRLYRTDCFIHGVGGWNYEWVGDRVIERFFKAEPPPYAVASGTFLIDDFPQRDFPFFFYPPREVKERSRTLAISSTE